MKRAPLVVSCLLVGLTLAPGSARAWDAAPMCTVHDAPVPWSHADRPGIVWAPPLEAQITLADAERLALRGDFDGARAILRTAAARFPRVRDFLAVREADVAMRAGALTDALQLYATATESVSPTVRLDALVGRVRALFALDDPRASAELAVALESAPEQSVVLSLRIAEGMAHERARRYDEALAIYRAIDLEHPGTEGAHEALARIAALAEDGHVGVPLTLAEHIKRAARLVSSGPRDEANHAVETLRARRDLDDGDRATVLALAARVARYDGRFTDADALQQESLALAPAVAALEVPADEVAEETVATEDADEARAHIRRITHGRPMTTVNSLHLPNLARLALVAHDDALLDEAVTAALDDGTAGRTRFEVAMVASGSSADARVLTVLDTLTAGDGELAMAARYHRARTLERLGRADEARDAFAALEATDFEGRYYALWAGQRLSAPRELHEGARHEDTHEVARVRTSETHRVRDDGRARTSAADALSEIADRYGRGYPWIGRAEDLLRLGAIAQARAELHETYVASRSSRRASPYGGRAPSLDGRARATIADVAEEIGDVRTAIAFGARYGGNDRPRAYESEVVDAARRYGVDPNLLFAVMRVESVFSPRAVSYVGATGLMQIMPRTGKLIGLALARGEITPSDLFDPDTNIELGAWYLASLIERFDGRVPLAIAAYNGGPHNVRRWIEEHGDDMPLDALLEQIPFEQTHRYVRRVLVHYAGYRADQGLPMVELTVALPTLRPDTVGF